MKFKMKKNSLKLLLASMLLATSVPALALTGDNMLASKSFRLFFFILNFI